MSSTHVYKPGQFPLANNMNTVDAFTILLERNNLILSWSFNQKKTPEALAIAVYANTLSLSPSVVGKYPPEKASLKAQEEYTHAMALATTAYTTARRGRDNELSARIDTFAKIRSELTGHSNAAKKAITLKIAEHQHAITTSIENLTRRKGEPTDTFYTRLANEAVESIADRKLAQRFADWTKP